MLELGRLSLGVGDRFAHQARAQLEACVRALERGVEIVPAALLEVYREGLANYLATGAGSLLNRPVELKLRRANGEEFPAELAITQHNLEDVSVGKSSARPFFERLVSQFGASRLLWASFFPARAPAEAPLKGLLDPIRDGLSFLPQADLDWILGDTARSLYPALTRR